MNCGNHDPLPPFGGDRPAGVTGRLPTLSPHFPWSRLPFVAGGFFRETHVSEVQPELAARLLDVARAIDNVLVAGHAQRHWLQPGHPPFRPAETGDRGSDATDVLAAAVAHYRGPSAALGLCGDHVQGGGRVERGLDGQGDVNGERAKLGAEMLLLSARAGPSRTWPSISR